MRWARALSLVLFAGCLSPNFSQALPEAARALVPAWRSSGQGEMRWFGLKLYDAELWVSGERYDPMQPCALELTYAREFSATRLAGASIDEMQRIEPIDTALVARWQQILSTVFADVRPGERITGVYLPGRGARFYHQERFTGEIADAELARRFFAIWLDARTREPALRARLIGTAR